MKLKKLILVPVLFASLIGNSQNANIKRTWHWYFGDYCGLDFSSGIAIADTSGQFHGNEGGSSISDTNGNLLFYTNGYKVWNHLNQLMPNGTGLFGGNGSSTQAALIVPKPLSNNIYYVFTTDQTENGGADGMRYSLVDMNLDGGNGDVDSTHKNVLLFAPSTEKQAAVNHCNDTCVWIMGHETDNSNYRAYLLTPTGIDTTNVVISTIGTPMTGGEWYGQMKFSPNGKMLATGMNPNISRMELYNFDNFTGKLSNNLIISDNDPGHIGVSFSPDNSKLYSGKTQGNQGLYQYNVTINDSTQIVNSKTTIINGAGYNFRLLQNGSDGKIYINHAILSFDSTLSVINNPNDSGLLCNFTYESLYLGGKVSASGLLDINESYFNQVPSSIGCLTGISELNIYKIKVYPNPARDWIVLEGKGIKSAEISNALGIKMGFYPATAIVLLNKIYFESISSGIYFLKVNMIDKRVEFQKIILQN